MVENHQQLHVQPARLLDIVGLSVRRASTFMALGIHASNDEQITSVSLPSNFTLDFVPTNLTIEQVRQVQKSFRPWIVGNGLRELDQGASIFADKLFEIRKLVEFNGKKIPQSAIDAIDSFADGTNTSSKLRAISENFGIDSSLRKHVASLSKARNALSHNMSIVNDRHCTEPGQLVLSWRGFEMVIAGEVIAGDFSPMAVAAGTEITFTFPERERVFARGEVIVLSPHDLSEICQTYWLLAKELTSALVASLASLGIATTPPAGEGGPATP